MVLPVRVSHVINQSTIVSFEFVVNAVGLVIVDEEVYVVAPNCVTNSFRSMNVLDRITNAMDSIGITLGTSLMIIVISLLSDLPKCSLLSFFRVCDIVYAAMLDR